MEFCKKCNNTGATGDSDYLDCGEPGCTAATERADFDKWLLREGYPQRGIKEWSIYRHAIRTAVEALPMALEEIEQLKLAKENLIQQAQQQAMEARTQRSIVSDILKHFGCADESWHALELIKAAAPQQHAQEPSLTKMVEAAKKFTFNYYKIKAGTTYDLPSAAYYVGLIKAMRIPTQQHAQAVHQWRKAGAANWYDGHPDNEDGGGPYEVRTLYAQQHAQAALSDIEDPITMPRGLIGAACSAIDKKRDAPNTLAQLRRYTTGDLSSQQPAAAPSAPVAAETRPKHAELLRSNQHLQSEIKRLQAALAATPALGAARQKPAAAPSAPKFKFWHHEAIDAGIAPQSRMHEVVGPAGCYVLWEDVAPFLTAAPAIQQEGAALDERAEFEAWCYDKHAIGGPDRGLKEYANSGTQAVWQAWQARAALAAPAPVQRAPWSIVAEGSTVTLNYSFASAVLGALFNGPNLNPPAFEQIKQSFSAIMRGEKPKNMRKIEELLAAQPLSDAAPVDTSTDPIVEMNVAMLRQRSAVGVKKYGVTMADAGLDLGAWLSHALEEGLDQVNYLQAALRALNKQEPTS